MASIYLSPSTQESNWGAGNYGTEEQRMNQLTDLLEPLLIQQGLTLYRNRPDMRLSEVVKDSNQKRPSIHLSIHSNAGGGRGAEVYCHRFGGEGEKLARAIYRELSPLTPTGDRGVKEGYSHYGTGKPLYELAYTAAPAVLVEIAFHDNPEDARWIMGNMAAIAGAFSRAVATYFNTSPVPFAEFKRIIQERCGFSNPEGVWKVVDTHPYPEALYRTWAQSYGNTGNPVP